MLIIVIIWLLTGLISNLYYFSDELPVRLTLPLTIREAKNRQQLSSLALLGQEFWRYPMANLRSDESQNSSPNNNKFDSLCCSKGVKRLNKNHYYLNIHKIALVKIYLFFYTGKKVIKENEEIVLDLVPLNHDPKHSSLLSTFKTSPVSGVCSITEESKPKRPHTLDLITTNIG